MLREASHDPTVTSSGPIASGPGSAVSASPAWLGAVAALALTLFASLSGCSSEAGKVSSDEDDEEVQLSTYPLSEGRSIEVENWEGFGEQNKPVGKFQISPFGIVEEEDYEKQSPYEAIFAACTYEHLNRILGEGASGSCDVHWKVQLIANCAGHWALTFAQEVVPYYIVRSHYLRLEDEQEVFAVVDDPSVMPAFFQQEPFNIDPAEWEQNRRVLYAVYPPSTSNAASWSLLAADFFRGSVVYGTDLFDPAKCALSEISHDFKTADGETLSLRDSVAANLSDALSGAMEAAELAQKFLNASAAAKGAAGTDRQTAEILAWRGRHDSRLEGASAFVPVPATAFEGRGLVELTRMVQKDEQGEIINYLATTTPEVFVGAGFERDVSLGWIYELNANPEPDLPLKPLRIWRDHFGSADRYSTHTEGSEENPPCVGANCTRYWALVGRQGWVPTGSGPGRIMLREYSKPFDGGAHYVLAPEGQPPQGWFDATSRTVWVLDPEQQNFTGDYPVVTAFATSAADKRAEDLLRTYRVNPLLGMTPVSGQPGSFALEDALLAAMNIAQEGAFNRLLEPASPDERIYPHDWNYQSKGFALLGELGISRDELSKAAQRIQQTSMVLGRPIVVDTSAMVEMGEGQPHHALLQFVKGTESSPAPVNPWYLHALTGGGATPVKDTTSDSNWRVTSDHARQGILHTLDYFRDMYLGLSAAQRDALGDSTRHMLESAMAWVKTQITGRVVVGLPLAESQSPYQFLVLDTPAASNAEVEERYDIWLGELGLQCALGQGAEGCESSDAQRIQDEASWSRATTTIGDATRARAVLSVEGSLILFGTRVYITEKTDSGREVIASLTVTPGSGPYDASLRWYAIPYGPALTRAMSASLAADPTNPEESMLTCAGVPRDVKFGLENELSEGVTGADDIESSYAYYLQLAREAATTADELGDQLVEQGLRMDLRAEGAREELEALCGGVINVGRLEEAACNGHDCDIVQLLEDGAASVSGDARLEVENLRRCLGIEGSGLDWATIGNVDLCVWQYKESATRVHPPCVCPDGVSACENLMCAVQLSSSGDCGALLGGEDSPLPDLDDVSAPGLGARTLDKNLNVYVTSKDGQPPVQSRSADGGLVTACRDILRWRAELEQSSGSWEGLRSAYDWVNQNDLRTIASRIGYSEDELGIPTVTLGGAPWLSFGGRATGMADPAQLGWPCNAHPELNANSPQRDPVGVSLCSEFTDPETRPFLCGGLCNGPCAGGTCSVGAPTGCGGDGCSTQEQRTFYDGLVNGWQSDASLRTRLRDAVMTLKGITGASWGNVARRQLMYMSGPGASSATDPKLFKGPAQDRGLLPAWVPDIGGEAWLSTLDGNAACWAAPSGSDPYQCSFLLPSQRPELARAAPGLGADLGGGWPSDPQFLWTHTCNKQQVFEANGFDGMELGNRVVGCGALLKVLDVTPIDEASEMRATLLNRREDKSCPSIPEDVCVMDWATPICGQELRASKYECIWQPPFEEEGACARVQQPSADFYQRYSCDVFEEGRIGSKVSAHTVVDALELACAVKEQQEAGCETLLSEAFAPNTAADFPTLASMLRCAADRVEFMLERMFVGELSSEVISDLAQGAVAGTVLETRGQYGEVVSQLVGKLQSMRSYSEAVVQGLRDMSLEFDASEIELQALDLSRAIDDVQHVIDQLNLDKEDAHLDIALVETRAAIAGGQRRCAVGVVSALSGLSSSKGALGVSDAGLSCATHYNIDKRALEDVEATQQDIVAINQDIRQALTHQAELRGELTEKEKLLYMVELSRKLSEQWDKINESRRLLIETYTGIQGLMIKLEDQRMQARRAAAKVLMLESDDLGRQYAVNSAMRARMNTLRVRYERARDHAIRMSYLARRALEQKIGMDLSFMDEPVGWVPAPSSWADTVCTQKGINYNEVRTGGRISEEEATSIVESQGPYNYADRYIGEYVSLLEQFMEAYQHEYPFQDGDDIAVVSLRDEILGVRAPKMVGGPNLLLWTQHPAAQTEPEAWSMTCDGQQCAALQGVSEQSPFFCRDAAGDLVSGGEAATCRPMGMATAVELGRTEDEGVPVVLPPGVPNPTAWFRADSCLSWDEMVACEDLSGNGTNFDKSWSSPVIEQNSVNGWPALNYTGTSVRFLDMYPAQEAPQVTSYTMSFAVRAPTATGQAARWLWVRDEWRDPEMTYRDRTALIVHYNTIEFFQIADYGIGPDPMLVSVSAPLPTGTAPVIITVRVTPERIELFVNGVLRATDLRPHLPNRFGDAALGYTQHSLRIAEAMFFEEALADLSGLHTYMQSRYLTTPAVTPGTGGPPAGMAQELQLASGDYLLSWYQRVGEASLVVDVTGSSAMSESPTFEPGADPLVSAELDPPGTEQWLRPDWRRLYGVLSVPEGGRVKIAWRAPSSPALFAAPQLERMTPTPRPGSYFPTGETALAPVGLAEDKDGQVFRSLWSPGSEFYCPAGTGSTCADDADVEGLPQRAFQSLRFSLSPDELARVVGFNMNPGNFNHRILDVAVNMVGKRLKDCAASANPVQCRTQSFIQYSLRHSGPFQVENYVGDRYAAPLYPGRVQDAKALVAERYFTNPLSTDARSLLTDYWSQELSGRPLSGNLELRVYADEDLRWEGLEDIQLVIRHRYWTRLK